MDDFIMAAALQPCLFSTTPAALLSLIQYLICLEIRALTCFLNNLKAPRSRRTTLPAVLSSYAPIVNPLNLASTLFVAAGLQPASPQRCPAT
jgi:hypothetical protein